ncbi:MAG: sulfurtransferase-like selenium metabolism protein YedF [Lachnospiraceae bacterium]|nr:sulfurtransferase-like selenium metabolism protein YedF [Lachnospiraceae bacterium]
MITVNAMGDACPIPVVKTLKVLRTLKEAETVEVLVDNEVAVQNLTRMAESKSFPVKSEQPGEKQYRVVIEAGAAEAADGISTEAEAAVYCDITPAKKKSLVVISSEFVGSGDPELGKILMKSFLYALAQQEELPDCILFYNGGAKITTAEGPMLDDLKSMAEQGTEILTCGTCLNHYGLTEELKVGGVTNMYTIVEKMAQADTVIKP